MKFPAPYRLPVSRFSSSRLSVYSFSVCTLSLSFFMSSLPAAQALAQDVMTITVTGESKPLQQLTSSVHAIPEEEINRINPAHPSDVLNRQAGVHINNLGGEGHMTAIRQPITTSAVYLFLEDGIPTRPSGLFNHNALYEVNIPQAKRIEIIKGPGSALYGSESIGGVINTITEPSPTSFETKINPEIGTDGWRRLLVSTGNQLSEHWGGRLNLNITENDGYRDEADYSRISSTLRLDGQLSEYTTAKTVIAFSQIEQSGIDALEFDLYEQQSTFNHFHNDVGRRNVDALRISTEFATLIHDTGRATITPYFRDNQMKLMPSWMLTYDPNDRDYEFQSYGVLAKYRHKTSETFEWIVGLDMDYSPASYTEERISATIVDGIYVDTAPTGRINYDYTADQFALAPYFHTEWQATEKLRLTLGLRYDYFDVDYQDNLDASVVQSQSGADRFTHIRPESQELSFDHFNPKLGFVWNMNPAQALYGSYRHSFRAPSIGSLFRSGSTTNTNDLNPVQTDSFEVGTRGTISAGVFKQLNYDIAFYHMAITDDIVRVIDQDTLDRKVSNAGKTEHQGIEITVSKRLAPEWSIQVALSYTNQEFKDFTALIGFPAAAVNYAGNEVPRAPKTLASASLRFEPLALLGTMVEFELNHVGEYFTDETNSQTYGGHTLAQLIASHSVNSQLDIYGRITNIGNRVYSTYTSNQVGDPDLSYRLGSPRSFFLGFKYAL